MIPNDKKEVLELVILFAGRDPQSFLNEIFPPNRECPTEKEKLIEDILSSLLTADLSDERFTLLNSLLLVLGIPPTKRPLFDATFGNISFSNIEDLKRNIERIRSIYLLKMGSFYLGYRLLRNADKPQLDNIINEYIITDEEKEKKNEIVRYYRDNSRKIQGFENIPIHLRWCLGYLAPKEQPKINGACRKLIPIFEKAVQKGVTEYRQLNELAKDFLKPEENLEDLLASTGVDTFSVRFPTFPHPLTGERYLGTQYTFLLQRKLEEFRNVAETNFEEVRERGRKNTFAYLSTGEIDIYFATSMRTRLDFLSNANFIEKVIKSPDLERYNILYFDPTQSYLDDRIQKGLIESIMIKKCKMVVYNAGEKETFGKDSEAGIALAHGKFVVVYVPRVLPENNNLREFYQLLDTPYKNVKKFAEELNKLGYIDDKQLEEIYKLDSVERAFSIDKEEPSAVIYNSQKLRELFFRIPKEDILRDLLFLGYNLGEIKDTHEYAYKKMILFEHRAMLFRQIHPLAFQVSPIDGVARGLLVARTPDTVAKIIRAILLKENIFKIQGEDPNEKNYLLVDNLTNSPIRVMPKDSAIRLALSKAYEEVL